MITCLDKRYYVVDDLPGEQWCLINDYNHSKNRKYELSSKGRVRSTSLLSGKIRIRKPTICQRHARIEISKKDKIHEEQPQLHRLVATYFIPNPLNKTEVHHIDGNPLNNLVDNLMWVTSDEHKRLHGKNPRKYIVCYDNNNSIINVYNTDDVHVKYLTEEEYHNLQ